MDEENKLGEILKKEGFNLQDVSAGIQPNTPPPFKYLGLNSSIGVYLEKGEEEIIVHITKIKDSDVYMAEFYKKE